jgi:excisionase family DNA binding protein
MNELLTAKQAAAILGYSDTLIRQRIKSGELPATKDGGSWRISRADVERQKAKAGGSEAKRTSSKRSEERAEANFADGYAGTRREGTRPIEDFAEAKRSEAEFGELASRISQLDRDKDHLRAELGDARAEASRREEAWKARVIDLERELTVRDSRNVDLSEQVSVLEAKVREILEKGQDEALRLADRNADLADRIADLVTSHEAMHARVVELQPVAEKVPMLQAAVEEKDASLSERERELNAVREDIEAIASRPVAGPVFRYLTKGRLRR